VGGRGLLGVTGRKRAVHERGCLIGTRENRKREKDGLQDEGQKESEDAKTKLLYEENRMKKAVSFTFSRRGGWKKATTRKTAQGRLLVQLKINASAVNDDLWSRDGGGQKGL